jgi:glutamyl-tRNA reductase
MKKAIEVAKRCFSETEVASKPISTAFLAWQRLQEQCPNPESRLVLIGAGQINRSICEFVRKSRYTNIVVANRSLPAAEELAERVNGKAILLEDLNKLNGFDVIISCTGAVSSVINAATYVQMVNGEQDEKLIRWTMK